MMLITSADIASLLDRKVLMFNEVHLVIMCGTFPPARTSDLPRSRGSIPALLATPLSPPRRYMKDPVVVSGLPDDFVSRDDEGLFAYITALRLSVKTKVAVEQERGLSLSEIVVQVREMVRLAEEEGRHPKAFPSRAFRAISRQALAWCIESYRPLVVTTGDDFSLSPDAADPLALHGALDRAGASDRLPATSPNFRGLP
jgi:hypothetical protein